MSGHPPAGPAAVNPFAPTAVAAISRGTQRPVTVRTAAVRRATGVLDTYLAACAAAGDGVGPDGVPDDPSAVPPPVPGNVVAVVGDYGTGKTHLADLLMVRLREAAPDNGHTVYVEASRSASFLSLYREFMGVLRRDHDLPARVREYYTDVVADWLVQTNVFPPEIAAGLRGGETTTRHLADTFGLTEASHVQELQRRLRAVTRSPDIALALSLLAREGFEADVLDWLGGACPAASLTGRGIAGAIDTDSAALEAMGVFALLYGHRNHRFMLVVDEIEKLLLDAARAPEGLAGFKKLLEVFAAAGGFLVIVGLPDVVTMLGPSTLDRVGCVVTMPPLDSVDVRELVLESNASVGRGRTLDPFTPEALQYLVQLAGGSPRRVVRLLHRCHADAVQAGGPMTPDRVREAAPGLSFFTRDHVVAAVRHLAGREGLRVEADRRLSAGEQTLVDLWVPAGRGGTGGVGFMVTDSVLTPTEARRLADAGRAVRRAAPGAEVRLLVAGWVSPDLDATLTEAFGAAPVVYRPDRAFDDALLPSLRGARGARRGVTADDGRADDGGGADVLALTEQVEQVRRQQDAAREVLERLAEAVDRAGSDAALRAEALEARVTGLRTALGAAGVVPPEVLLPAGLQQVFDEVDEAAAQVFRLPQVFDVAFEPGPAATGRRSGRSRHVVERGRDVLAAAHALEGLGVLQTALTLATSLQQAVTSWWARHGADGAATTAAQDSLRALCLTYDELFGQLERRFTGWDELDSWWVSATGDARRAALGSSSTVRRTHDLREQLHGLGASVLHAGRRLA